MLKHLSRRPRESGDDDSKTTDRALEWLTLLRPGTYSGADGYKFVDEKRSRIRFPTNRITLRLNPNEHDHQDLLKRMRDLENAGEQFFGKQHEMIALSQTILKREWVRVKRGR